MSSTPISTLNYSHVIGHSGNFDTLADLAASLGLDPRDLRLEEAEFLPEYEQTGHETGVRTIWDAAGNHIGSQLFFDVPVTSGE